MPTITNASVPIFRSRKTPLLVVPCRRLGHSQQSHSSADSITNMSGWLKCVQCVRSAQIDFTTLGLAPYFRESASGFVVSVSR
jgi:hypothetical protein